MTSILLYYLNNTMFARNHSNSARQHTVFLYLLQSKQDFRKALLVDAWSQCILFAVKPQPISAFKPAAPVPEDVIAVETGSLKRPPRPPYANRQNSSGTPSNHSSLSKDHLKMTLVSWVSFKLNHKTSIYQHLWWNLLLYICYSVLSIWIVCRKVVALSNWVQRWPI